ncbi:MAG: NAD(P)H-dependent oxidoreductase [Alphaproteobacteria bacterium]|nr:NAD(P)H-dependent oxidoreductase [Alphaproteobacteria bacterium]
MNLNIIITSTRPGRNGLPVANWFHEFAKAHAAGFDVTLTDLAALNLPILDEPNHPAQKNYTKDHTKNWSKIVERSDAFVFVLPEYNFTAPPAFINAVDYLYSEWAYKPAAFVSYGGVSGGLRAVQTAKLMLTTLNMMPIPDQVMIPGINNLVTNGTFTPNEHHETSAEKMIAALARWAAALSSLRA